MTTDESAGRNGAVEAIPSGFHGSAGWWAERALLGALLRHPPAVAEVRDWLQPQDFADPLHRAVFATTDGLHAAGEQRPVTGEPTNSTSPTRQGMTGTVLAIHQAIISQRFTDSERVGYGALLDLYEAGAIAAGGHYVRYGRMVLESSVRRQLETWAIRMEPSSSTHSAGDRIIGWEPAIHQAMMADLADLSARVQRSTGSHSIELPAGSGPSSTTFSTAQVPHKILERAEMQVIHAVITDPCWRASDLLRQLQPEDFTASSAHANTWRAIQAIAARGDPIDPVTVAWETEVVAAQVSIVDGDLANTAGLSAAQLCAMATRPIGDTHRAVALVADAALAYRVQLMRDDLGNAANDRGRTVHDALATARAAGTAVETHATRLARATIADEPNGIRHALDGDRPPGRSPIHPLAKPAIRVR